MLCQYLVNSRKTYYVCCCLPHYLITSLTQNTNMVLGVTHRGRHMAGINSRLETITASSTELTERFTFDTTYKVTIVFTDTLYIFF
jgi:hypothetical protein